MGVFVILHFQSNLYSDNYSYRYFTKLFTKMGILFIARIGMTKSKINNPEIEWEII